MTESTSAQPDESDPRQGAAKSAPESDGGEAGDHERKVFGMIVDSVLRVCTNAQYMLDRDDLWVVRKDASVNEVMDVVFDSVRDCEQEYRRWRQGVSPRKPKDGNPPHPLGAVAELLAAKTLATFGGSEAVQDLSKWMHKANSRRTGR
jgi:hypothetical protein